MDINGKHVAVLVHNYFEQSEFDEPISAIKEAGGEVTIISADKVELQALEHVDKGDTFQADLLLAQANADDYDALVLPGGAINADNLRVIETAQQWVTDFLDSGKPVAVICHAPWLLVSADAVEGKRLTSYHTIKDDITNAGGEWIDFGVVVDNNLITSRRPDDLPKFNHALLRMLAERSPGTLQEGVDTIVGDDEKANENDSRLRSLGYDKNRDQLDEFDESEILADSEDSDADDLRVKNV